MSLVSEDDDEIRSHTSPKICSMDQLNVIIISCSDSGRSSELFESNWVIQDKKRKLLFVFYDKLNLTK